MNVETPSTIRCPACSGTANAVTDDQWGLTDGWRCRDCHGFVELDGDRRTFDVTTIETDLEFDLASVSTHVNHVMGIDSPRVVPVGSTDDRYRITTNE